MVDAVLFAYPVHGTCLDREDWTLSREVSGAIEQYVEQGFDHPVMAMYFNSWGADMGPGDPTVQEQPGAQLPGGYDRMNRIGRVVAEEVHNAAEAVHLLGEILALPQQFDTLLGERGITLSGGQKQRLTLARALLLHRPLLVLDDCLSSVDAQVWMSKGELPQVRVLDWDKPMMSSSGLVPVSALRRTADMHFISDWMAAASTAST